MTSKGSLEYIKPNTTITLREGIQELRQAEGIENDTVENVAFELAEVLDVGVQSL